MVRHLHFIGQDVEPDTGRFVDKLSPVTGLKIAEVAVGSAAAELAAGGERVKVWVFRKCTSESPIVPTAPG